MRIQPGRKREMLSRERVEAVLFKMGMPANVKGFGYIVDSVLLLEKDSKIKITYLYFKVAQLNGTTGQRVERVIPKVSLQAS